MRILAVGNMYPPHHLGGYELIWRAAMREATARGHDVRVLTTDFRRAHAEGERGDGDVSRELRWYWRDHHWPRLRPDERLRLELHNRRVLDRHIREHRPDVVSWWSMGGMSLSLIERAHRHGLASVAFVHDDWLIYGPEVDGWIRMFARRPWAAGPARRLTGVATSFDESLIGHWLFVSETTLRSAEDAGRRFPAGSASVAHSGVASEFLEPTEPRPWQWRLLYVGRIDARKGIATAVAALAHLPPEAALTVVGEGDARELARLRGLASELRVDARVEFTGSRERERLPATYADADVLIFPVEWDEPWGLIPLEAMGVGRPVVATGRGGSAEYLRDGENCLLFPVGDSRALAARIERLAADEGLRAGLRAAGFSTAAAHTESQFAAQAVAAMEGAAARS